MFEVEKPRRFHYEPRFYDPEKEKWEAMKKRYAIEQEKNEALEKAISEAGEGDELAYFEQRVKEIEKKSQEETAKLGWRDLFRKREMPKFNYQPRFVGGVDTKASAPSTQETVTEGEEQNGEKSLTEKYAVNRYRIKIKRRFDISDTEYMKPISGTKIILYCFIVFLLVTLIIGF